ncbi:MAG: helix-turn-helix transcriptional regulator [Chthoniobacterales bacterium]|nr:helix-turn-helix transcriptional regulator [Chthoniobacterales bacterium]
MDGCNLKLNPDVLLRMLLWMRVSLVSQRLRELRRSLEISQEALGAQGFVSAPGWAKIENGTRQPSDDLLEKLTDWMVKYGYLKLREKSRLLDELLSLKYMEHLSPFVCRLARDFHQSITTTPLLRVAEPAPTYRAKRKR